MNKTSTITFRISQEYESKLRKKAEEQRTSLNTLANQIFEDYLESQQFINKFGTIILSRDAFKMILDIIDEPSIEKLGKMIGENAPKEFILFKWKEITVNNILEFIKMFTTHCINSSYDFELKNEQNIFSIRHGYGEKGSLFLKSFFESAIMKNIHKRCDIVTNKNSLIIRI